MSLRVPSVTYKPFKYDWAVELCRDHENIHWVEDEVDLSEDVKDWNIYLTPQEKNHITQILRLFTQSDLEVGKVYYDSLIPVFRNNEVRNMLGSFACREAIHQRAYALLNDTLGLDDKEYEAFLQYEVMNDKVDFMTECETVTEEGVARTIAKAVMNEGISLFASFVMLLNYQRFGKMKGMGKVVEWSIRDESMHVLGVSRLFREFLHENQQIDKEHLTYDIQQMCKQCFNLESLFVDLAYEMGEIEGLEKEEVKTYIEYISDRRLIQLGIKPIFDQRDNPLFWLDWIMNGADHTNFFEARVTEYSVSGMSGDWGWDRYLSDRKGLNG